MKDDLADLISSIRDGNGPMIVGKIIGHQGSVYQAKLMGVSVGDLVEIESLHSTAVVADSIVAKVISFNKDIAWLSPFSDNRSVVAGAKVTIKKSGASLNVNDGILGSIVNALGETVYRDNSRHHFHPNSTHRKWAIDTKPPEIPSRARISEPLETGLRTIDGLLTIGKGQRLGVFADAGAGKSTLMSTLANSSKVDVNVIGLIGERGKEVIELYQSGLTQNVRDRTVIIASTSDEPAISRITAAYTAHSIAEYFRDAGKNVLLQIDSLTRLFRAYREIGLSAGELPVRRGYPASAYTNLPKLIERAGKTINGSITALYSVLLSSSVDEDPMVEEVKSLTDGHIVLSRSLADREQYPAIDVLRSLSRSSSALQTETHNFHARRVRRLLSDIEYGEELLHYGCQIDNSIKEALDKKSTIKEFATQSVNEISAWIDTMSLLAKV